MTAGSFAARYMCRKPGKDLVDYLLDPSLSVSDAVSEFVSVLAELAEKTNTLCAYRRFLIEVSVAFAIVLGLTRETKRRELAEKAVEIMEVGFQVFEELERDKYSCRAIEHGLETITRILEIVDELLGNRY